MELKVPVKKENNTKAKLRLLSPVLKNLTETEVNIISTMLDLGLNDLGGDNRVTLRSSLKTMTKYNFNNFTKRLIDKGIFYLNPDKVITLHPKVRELTKDNNMTITFVPYEE